jgi:hypothetical protein
MDYVPLIVIALVTGIIGARVILIAMHLMQENKRRH